MCVCVQSIPILSLSLIQRCKTSVNGSSSARFVILAHTEKSWSFENSSKEREREPPFFLLQFNIFPHRGSEVEKRRPAPIFQARGSSKWFRSAAATEKIEMSVSLTPQGQRERERERKISFVASGRLVLLLLYNTLESFTRRASSSSFPVHAR